MADETRALANFAASLSYEQVPAHVRTRAVDLLVDQIGCEIGCSDLPWAKQVLDVYRVRAGTPDATVVRYGDRLPVGSAAFINSTFGHSFEYDDANPYSPGHPGAELIPSLMAIAEHQHLSGRDFLMAFIAAYEVRGRIGRAVYPDMSEHGGPHSATACGPFAAAAGIARLLKLGSDGIYNALGIAGAYSGGLMQYDQGGGSVKRIYTAIATSSGLQAAYLAQAGMTGPEEILEGVHGFLRIYSSAYRPERLVADFGKTWAIEHATFKAYCCNASIHPAIDGFSKLITGKNIKVDDIGSVEVFYPTRSYKHAAVTSPHDLLGMQFSTSYALALTILKHGNTPREYTIEALTDPEIRAFAAKVHVREDAELSKRFEGGFPARINVRTESGDVYEEIVGSAKGSRGAPLSSAEVDDKFRSQVAGVFGSVNCENLMRVLRNVDALDDMGVLSPMLVAPGSTH